MLTLNRRGFLASAAAATCAFRPWSRVLGANSDIRVAVIGLRNIGKTHLMNFPKIPGVRVVGACDVDSQVLGERTAEFEKEFGSIKKYEDLREVFDDPGVDAVVLAVPNHWHALGTVWACQAGKDVYVEKPCSYNIWEAGQMLAASRKYDRIVQVGIQRRSLPFMQEWLKELRGGALGKIQSVRALYFARRQPIGNPKLPIAPPPTVNHNLWSGPAPTELKRETYHYDWHWFWEQGNGELGNNGPHVLDLARTVIGANEFPENVWSVGGRYQFADNGETPNSHLIHYGYAPVPIIMEIRNLPEKAGTTQNTTYRGLSVGLVVDCEGGSYVGFDKGTVYDKDGKEVKKIQGSLGEDGGRQNHRLNFIQAVRSRRTEDLNCSVQQGHLSSSLCHLGNISHRLGEMVSMPAATERIRSEGDLSESARRMWGHLQANDVDVKTAQVQLGQPLKFDPQSQRFPESEAANGMLKREYRAPFVVPDEV